MRVCECTCHRHVTVCHIRSVIQGEVSGNTTHITHTLCQLSPVTPLILFSSVFYFRFLFFFLCDSDTRNFKNNPILQLELINKFNWWLYICVGFQCSNVVLGKWHQLSVQHCKSSMYLFLNGVWCLSKLPLVMAATTKTNNYAYTSARVVLIYLYMQVCKHSIKWFINPLPIYFKDLLRDTICLELLAFRHLLNMRFLALFCSYSILYS